MNASSDKILLDRLIYLQIFLLVPLMIFLLPLLMFPDSMPDSYWEIFTLIFQYLSNPDADELLDGSLSEGSSSYDDGEVSNIRLFHTFGYF